MKLAVIPSVMPINGPFTFLAGVTWQEIIHAVTWL